MLNRLLGFCVVCIVLGTVLYRRKSHRYPPGPPGLPLVGNLFQVPLKKIWIRLDSWKKIYGPILYLNLAGQPIIVLNTKKVTVDLLERRATNYSSRPRFIVAGEYLNGGWNMILTEYGDIWRRMRRSSEYALGLKATSQYQPAQSDEAVLLAYDLIHSTNQWENHIFRAVASSITSLVYDLPPLTSFEDYPTIEFLLDLVRRLEAAMYPGSYAVEFLPILDWLPPWLAKWKREAIKDCQRYTSKFERMFSNVKDASVKGEKEQSSFCATVLEPGARHNLSERELAWLAGSLFMAGYETSSNTLSWFMYFMILFPEIQAKAQEQLDQVVERSRLPTFADAKHLPYIWAIIKEMLRWRPPVPICVPHATVADDYYEGYFIPKNSIVIPNIWSINRDPEVYDDRIEDFYPERYLDCDGNLKDALDEGHFAFGFGHRSCVGRHVANNTLFVDIATILWAMKIEPAKDAYGKSIVPSIDDERADGIALHPPKCQFTCTPRFDEVDMILQQARDDILKGTRYSRE
ncbi:cytochrome P450 [Dendrothele bispora CBS 962.96]|uniref:Cytochrome P450 n=1 Tax=Dendrothele bispora (strain CBS 962.96) TaxID=1314807 RepID=A0A4S8KUA6_DENBC|nr:cytochrome P450 [Dendrothele bispora CBS 962.96]